MSSSGQDERSAVEALEKSRRRFSLALEAARAGAWEWEIGTNRTIWSPENYALLGLPAGSGEAAYEDWFARVHPEDRERATREVARAVESRGDLDFEYRVVWPDGTIRWLRDVGRTMLDDRGEPIGMYGIQIDVTERRALEDSVRQSQRIEAMGRVTGAVAHDFNNLLTVIVGYGSLLDEHPSLDEELGRMVKEILRAADGAADLTRQLLAFGRRQVLRPQVFDLNQLIAGLEDLNRSTLGEGIEYVTRLAPEPCSVRADPGQIEQVVLNLVVNARDAMPTGGRLTVRTFELGVRDGDTAVPSAPMAGPCVALSVQDTGHGMDRETLDRVFDPFFTTKPPGKGTGLGLASVHGIVEQSGGRVTVESSPGHGATFCVYLPRVDEPSVHASTAAAPARSLRGSETILVVDDEATIRELIGATLEKLGYSILLAASGEEALTIAAAREAPIDLLLTDVVLPGLTGPQLARRVCQERPGAAVLYMSGYGHDVMANHGTPGDPAEILQKPFSPRQLAGKVREVLGDR